MRRRRRRLRGFRFRGEARSGARQRPTWREANWNPRMWVTSKRDSSTTRPGASRKGKDAGRFARNDFFDAAGRGARQPYAETTQGKGALLRRTRRGGVRRVVMAAFAARVSGRSGATPLRMLRMWRQSRLRIKRRSNPTPTPFRARQRPTKNAMPGRTAAGRVLKSRRGPSAASRAARRTREGKSGAGLRSG